jgi:hypothetical protein
MSISLHCAICGEEIPRHLWKHGAYYQVMGWERLAGIRASGKHGGSDIVRRERTGKAAHTGCIEKDKDPQKETLF